MDIDKLAQEIRRVDGNHSLGAGALAEALLPLFEAELSARCASLEAEVEAMRRKAISNAQERNAAEAMCADLAKALEPFAALEKIFSFGSSTRPDKDSDPIMGWADHRVNNGDDVIIHVGDLRKAAKAFDAYRKEAAHE